MTAYQGASQKLAGLLLAVVVLGSSVLAAKQSATTRKKSGTIKLSGCLRKGEVAGRVSLKARDGKEYALRSVSLKLADYIGRTVSIKGQIRRDPGRDDYEFEGSEVNEEYGKKVLDLVDVDVEALKVVRDSCE